MNGERLGERLVAWSVVAAAALALLAAPVAAQGADSITEQLISGLNARLLAVAVPITLVVEGILFYTVWKFKDNDDPQPTKENRRLEITWTVATAVVLLFVGVASYGVMANPNVIATEERLPSNVTGDGGAASEAVVVEATGVQWFWRFHYPEHNVSTQDEMVIPTDRPIVIKTTSNDVVHAFHVPALSLKQDSLPGQWNYIRTEVYEPGTYRLYCAEYCGTGHSQMLANVTVMPPEEYDAWIEEQRTDGGGGNATADATADALAADAAAVEPA